MPKENIDSIDAYSPAQIAKRVADAGVSKTKLTVTQTLILSILGGAFIAFGGMFYTLVITNSGLGYGPERLIGGLAFSLGLILVIIAGAELFTGNNLIVLAWMSRCVRFSLLLKNWTIVLLGNFIGAVATAIIVDLSGILTMSNGSVSQTAQNIALAKIELPMIEAFFRGLLCNTLVCLAIWLSFSAHSVSGKILAIIFPVSAFVALGFEHSVANMYLIPIGYLASGIDFPTAAFLTHLASVISGNIVGGSFFVAIVYWTIYLNKKHFQNY